MSLGRVSGLVIGKFYPPHRGHHLLIDRALKGCDEVTVLVCDNPKQTIPASLRAEGLSEVHPPAIVKVIPDTVPDDDSAGWAEHTRRFLGFAPDRVFTSEDYGARFSAFLGAEHISVDSSRREVPISGTEIRRDPLNHLDFLAPCVRAYFVKRIVLLGPESTGKTVLARRLADRFNTVWVPEFGRSFSEGIWTRQPRQWATEDFLFIARKQNEMEDHLARQANRLLICDTDSFATHLWHERYMGSASEEVIALSCGRKTDLTLLLGTDVPFVQDGLRDGEDIRHTMLRRFEEQLRKAGRPYKIVNGTWEERASKAVEACEELLRSSTVKEELTR